MELKKSVIFSIGDIQEAVTLIAKKQGLIARDLTQSELKEIVENGSISIDMEYIETKPFVPDLSKLLPPQFFSDICGRVQGLSVFVRNVEHEVLYSHFASIVESFEEVDLIVDYYKKKTSKFPELGPKEIYGENWREKWEHIGEIYVSIGQNFLNLLQLELRKGTGTLKGVKVFNKESVIEDIKDLGFSKRTFNPFRFIASHNDGKPFILGEHISKQRLPDIYSWRNIGKKSVKEIEDFIMLYDL